MLSQLKSLLRPEAAHSASVRKEGDAHARAGRLDEAEAAYRRAISLGEGNVDVHVGLAFVYKEKGRHAAAKEALSRALTIDAGNADAHYMLGTIAKEEGDAAAAMSHFERAIQCRSDFEFAYVDLLVLLGQAGQSMRVKEVGEKAVAACPGCAALHDLRGRQLGSERDFAAAAASFRQAVALAPETKEYHKFLGDALDESGNYPEAIASLGEAVRLDPDYFDARVALARTMLRANDHDGAILQCRELLRQRPDYAIGHVNLGVALQSRGDADEAMACYRRGAELDPKNVTAHVNLGRLLAARGDHAGAIACLEKARQIDPRHPMNHYLDALKGVASERAPSDYVESLFDFYADNFDNHLVGRLKYSVPEKLPALLRPHAPGGAAPGWTVLDLGCGTGLAGVAVAPFSRSLVGVDLSAKMLDKARERKIYDRLEQRDLMGMMQGEPASNYDLILSADVFVYVGRLDEITGEACRLLRPGGLLAYSVEALDALTEGDDSAAGASDYRLNDTGRFAHAPRYLEQLRMHHGFEALNMTEIAVRENQGKPVRGYLILWKKPRVA